MYTDLESLHSYAVLFGGGPRVKTNHGSDIAQERGFLSYFRERITHLLRREYLSNSEYTTVILMNMNLADNAPL